MFKVNEKNSRATSLYIFRVSLFVVLLSLNKMPTLLLSFLDHKNFSFPLQINGRKKVSPPPRDFFWPSPYSSREVKKNPPFTKYEGEGEGGHYTNPVTRHKYVVCGSYNVVIHNIRISLTSIFSFILLCLKFVVPMTARRCLGNK